MKPTFYPWFALLLAVMPMASAKMTPEQVAALPAPVDRPVQFSKDIQPIFEASCIKCHGRGKAKGGFRLDTRETTLQGGDSGAALVPGRSAESLLIELVMGFDPDAMMPQKGSKLKKEQIALLRGWIDQGAKWDPGVTFGKLAPVNLNEPNAVLPSGPDAFASRNAIDMILERYYATHGIRPGAPVDDRVFARRVHLDVIGLLPTPDEIDRFVQDRRPDKRERLVRTLLADNDRYAAHWLTFWNDLLRNDYKGTGYIDGGRKQITGWLYKALADNMPYNRFVAQLVDPTPESEGFAKGIVWRGTINASQTPPMQAAQNISQVFMGVNLKCASCHDSFINDWTLADAYGLASVYADAPLEMVQCDKPTGHTAAAKFIYPELGGIDPKLERPERLRRLAQIVTQKQNGRLTRTIVNRLWQRFMGRGLIEPVDEMEQPAWNPELLDWLAADLAANRHDLKRTMERILTSQAYQLTAVPVQESQSQYVFRGPNVRRMSAEQYLDALSEITGVWHTLPAGDIDLFAGDADARRALSGSARWIWTTADSAAKAAPGTVYFARGFDLAELPEAAHVVLTCDNRFKLFVNGAEVGSGSDFAKPRLFDIRERLKAGRNYLAIEAVNDPAQPGKEGVEQSNPAGLVCHVRLQSTAPRDTRRDDLVRTISTDASWRWTTNKVEGWEKNEPASNAAGWAPALVLGGLNREPWSIQAKFVQVASHAGHYGRVRSSLVASDPLMTALGRPNREQVNSTRPTSATTLQCLELTNGQTLAEKLKKGAERLVRDNTRPVQEFIDGIYARALNRRPTEAERRLSADLVGSPLQPAGVEDLLWAMAMLPEFQLIY